MPELKVSPKIKNLLGDFTRGLEGIYGEELVSLVLYGSAASGEFIENRSNINLLVILKKVSPACLKKATPLVNKLKFRAINPLFLDRDYIGNSLDVFPVEFLDMKENYRLLYGIDILKDLSVATVNLRFQCEQELKSKLIYLRGIYLRENADKRLLAEVLFKSVTSVMHILRNVLRLNGRQAPYLKEDILGVISSEFAIDSGTWSRILSAKYKKIKLSGREIEGLFTVFLESLEKISKAVDKL